MIRVIITGGPSSGKTSLINALQKCGYSTFNEAARKIIQQQLELNTNNLPWDDIEGFSKLVLTKQIKDFKSANKDLSFYDRGIPDIIGYINHGKKTIFKSLKRNNLINRYDKVFILPPWKDIYATDNERRESFEQAKLIYNEIKKAYILSGYNPVKVPLDSVENRKKYILNKLSEYT